MLVRREFWEHRVAVDRAAGGRWQSSLLLAVFGATATWRRDTISCSPTRPVDRPDSERRRRTAREMHEAIVAARRRSRASIALSLLMFSVDPACSIVCIVVFFYLIDCLLTERQDRSILFWKSLPVSDARGGALQAGRRAGAVPIGAAAAHRRVSRRSCLLGIWWVRFHDT